MFRFLVAAFVLGTLVSCAAHQGAKFEPYERPRPGYQAPEAYEKLARKDASKIFKTYRDADFDHQVTEVVRYKGEDIWRRRVRVVFVRSEVGFVGAKNYRRTGLFMEYSPSGRLLSATRLHDAGLNGVFAEWNFAFDQESKATEGQNSETQKARTSPESTSRQKRRFLPEVETDYVFPLPPAVR